MIDLSWL